MDSLFFHLSLFILAVAIIFYFCGVLITSTDRIARHIHRSSFLIAFLLLGFLTSFSEISVAINASLAGTPQLSAGNLIGGSFVIFFLLIPILAILGNGINLKHALPIKHLALTLIIIAAPAFFVFDGLLTKTEGALMIGLYLFLSFFLHKESGRAVAVLKKEKKIIKKELYIHGAKIFFAALLIFLSGKIFVGEALYFSTLLHVPSSLIGLLVIAIGTNIPEFTITIASIKQRKKAIAFGDYIGSASFNTAILGGVALINGPITLDHGEFFLATLFLCIGLFIFFAFAKSKRTISRKEGIILGIIYLLFIFGELFLLI